MKLTRRQRRSYLTQTPNYKRMQKLRLNHPDKVEYQLAVKENGKKDSQTFFEMTQRSVAEQLSIQESLLLKKLNETLIPSNVNEYMEVWSDVRGWPATKDPAAKKKLKQLSKEYNIYG